MSSVGRCLSVGQIFLTLFGCPACVIRVVADRDAASPIQFPDQIKTGFAIFLAAVRRLQKEKF